MITIALLTCSINSLANNNDTSSSTGGVKQDSITNDSVLIAYNDLRIVNSKLIELEFEKEINDKLKHIVVNDSIIIDNLRIQIDNMDRDYKKRTKTIKKQRNIAGGIGLGAIVLLIISLL